MIIGIPHYDDFEGLKNVINTLNFSTSVRDYHIIVINSDETIKENVKDWNKIGVEVLNVPKEGPLKAYELLFNIAKEREEDLFLTQTDVTFMNAKRDWLKEMIEISKHENCGLVTCHGGGGVSGPAFIEGFRWVGAWCTYIPYRTIKAIGGFDMDIPLGYGVDIDYTYAVKKEGLKVYAINYWVDHNPNYDEGHHWEKGKKFEQKKQEAFQYMKKKWGLL